MANGLEEAEVQGEIAHGDRTDDLYLHILRSFIAKQVIDTSMRVLVVCGGITDRDTLLRAGFTDYAISNLDEDGAGYLGDGEWLCQDAEALTLPDNSFDFCIVHEGLHHCRSPHKAIIEMLRVAKRGILIIEPADNCFTSLGIRLGLGQVYEHTAILHNYRSGGVRNTWIPNYIYRFTARELRKTILCLEPTLKLDITFQHYLQIPWKLLKMRRSGLKKAAVALASPVLLLSHALMPQTFSNQIVAMVVKPRETNSLHPWLIRRADEITINPDWFAARFANKKTVQAVLNDQSDIESRRVG